MAGMAASAGTQEDRDRNAVVGELVRGAARGDTQAWNELVKRFTPMVQSIARSHRLAAADVADIVQTTWLKLVEHLDRIESPERVGAWLATTARRESLRLARLSGREIKVDDTALAARPAQAAEVDDDLLNAERDAVVRIAFHRLPARGQAILGLLMGDASLSYRDLSDTLDMPIGSIGPTRQRYLEVLRRLIAVEDRTLVDLGV